MMPPTDWGDARERAILSRHDAFAEGLKCAFRIVLAALEDKHIDKKDLQRVGGLKEWADFDMRLHVIRQRMKSRQDEVPAR
jgi:hypothetical protein